MNIDLRSAREKAGLSQSELAVMLQLSQAQISRYEQDPGSIPTQLLLRWAQALGTDINALLSSAIPLPPPLEVGDPYLELRCNLDMLEKYIADSYPAEDLDIPDKPPAVEDLKKQIHRYRQKPNLVLVGRFDSGKSHLANTLMGLKVLPSQYQPATRVITFVRHVSDRPDWFQDQVGILAESFWTKDRKNNQVFDLALLDSQSWFEKHCVKTGSLEVLRQHGVHDHFSNVEIEGHSAIVYVDSPLLKGCNIVDFPGYSDQADQVSEDVKKANSAVQIADLILYTSPVNGFMNAEDLSRLSYLLKVLPAPETHNSTFPVLGNLFIVGTHAHPGISGSQLSSALQTGSVRLYRHIEAVLEERSKLIDRTIKLEHFQRRFYAFWEEKPLRWEDLKKDLIQILGKALPKARRNRIDREVGFLKHDIPKQVDKQIRAYGQKVDEAQSNSEIIQLRSEFDELKDEEQQRKAQTEQGVHQIHQRIEELCDETKSLFKKSYEKMIHISAVEMTIRDRYKSDKKEAKEYAAGYLVEQLQSKLEYYIKEKSEVLKEDIDKFLSVYETALLKFPKLNIGSVSMPFNAKGAFLGGLAGAGGVGALALWANALGNLGAYILVAKFVSLLSALGISISGGVATVVSFVAAIGGPVTLAIGLFAAATAIGWAMFGESWERRLAKKIVNHFKDQQILDKFLQSNDDYWQDTLSAFDKGADATEEKFQEYIQHLQEICASDEESKEKIEKILLALRSLKSFFADIPWQDA
ncbi:MAG: dynamin family protein [Synechococcales bacterium]|nr:dynamin family protein [Synechococcales bacterium]